MHYNFRKKFTLIELLVVIAVIGVLLTILLPSLRNAKEASLTAISKSNLNQIYAATVAYASSNNGRIFKSGTNPHPRSSNNATNWSRMAYEQMIGKYLSFNGNKAKAQMAKGTAYYSVMMCPFLRLTRPEPNATTAAGTSDYSMNRFFKANNTKNAATGRETHRHFAKLVGEDEPMYVAGTKMGAGSAKKHFNNGTYNPTADQRPVYEYSSNRSIAMYKDGSLKMLTKSEGARIHNALKNEDDFQ
jgi:prepilin-type N-terminal cleavage/methylation domain-containing protein